MRKLNPISKRILIACAVLTAGITARGYYTEEALGTVAYPLPAWNMRDNENSWGAYLGPSQLPPGLNINNIIETNVSIFDDYNSGTGKPPRAQPFYRLNWRQPDGPNMNGPWISGGQFHIQCTDLPQCVMNLSRGAVNSNLYTSYFADNRFSSTANARGYLKLDYLKTSTALPPQVISNYFIPIGPWDMRVTPSNGLIEKTVNFGASLDLTKIISVSATIISDPVNGKSQVNYFERRGFAGETPSSPALKRGGEFDYTNTGVTLRLRYKTNILSVYGNQANMFNDNHASTSGNRGWIKLTYAGIATGIKQPYAVKSRLQAIGPWPIYADMGSGVVTQPDKTMLISSLGGMSGLPSIPGNRFTYAEATIHSDIYASGSEQNITSLRRTAYAKYGMNTSDHGLFYINETSGKIVMLATGSDATPVFKTYYSSFHANGGSYNRGWFRADYLAAQCNEGSGYTRLFPGFTSNGDDCHGNFGSGTAAVHVIQTKAGDIWGTNDQLAFIHKSGTAANFSAVVRLDNQENTSGWAKAGVMIRLGTAANSAHASILFTPGNGIQWTYRSANNGTTVHPATTGTNVALPMYLRVSKTANSFTGAYSVNGVNWNQLGSAVTLPISAGATYYPGLAATSFTGELNTTVFSNVNF